MTDQASKPHHIVVAGGGAAGLELVTKLGNTLGKRGRARITLVERSRTHLWKPLLHSVAAGSIQPAQHELNYLAQAHWHHFTYRYGEVTGLDRAAKHLMLAAMHDEEGREITPATALPYDTLIMAIGSDMPAMIAAAASASSNRLAAGTTRETRPARSASVASIMRAVKHMSIALLFDTALGRRCVPPAPGMVPSLISG